MYSLLRSAKDHVRAVAHRQGPCTRCYTSPRIMYSLLRSAKDHVLAVTHHQGPCTRCYTSPRTTYSLFTNGSSPGVSWPRPHLGSRKMLTFGAQNVSPEKSIMNGMGVLFFFLLLYAGFETCFSWDPQHLSVLGSDSKIHLKIRFGV